MHRLRRLQLWVGLWAFVLATVVVAQGAQTTQAPPAQRPAPTDRIPVDPRITVRTLPNGLRTYVRVNKQPAGRAELRLVVNAGSVQEEDDQRGLAHFVEHMAFNGTRRFPRQDMAAFLQSIGMRFGSHVNAYTGYDETVYQLHVPTDDPRVFTRALDMIEDWAQGVVFDPAEIERERGVVLEEWRLGLGADARIRDAQWPVLLKGSPYAERFPIGLPDVIRQASRDRIRQFYRDWYRPELMAVIAVGDFDGPAVDLALSARFGTWPTSFPPKTRNDRPIPEQEATRFAIGTDPEAGNTTVGLVRVQPAREQGTFGYYRAMTIDRLIAAMFNERLADVSRRTDAPFLAAQAGRTLFVKPAEITMLQALVADPVSLPRGLTALQAEWLKVARFGFTAEELDRQSRSLARGMAQALVENNTSPSVDLADEFVRNFLHGESLPGIVREEAMLRDVLGSLTLEEVNRVAASWLPSHNRVVMVGAPSKAGAPVPDAGALGKALQDAEAVTSAPTVERVDNSPLVERAPAPGRIVREETHSGGLLEWRLNNGVRVVVLPTTHKTDEVVLRAVSPGGWSRVPEADHVAGVTASDVVTEGGLGRWSRAGLVKRLAGVNAGMRMDIDTYFEGVRGAASAADLETLLQLVYLSFTAPRSDAESFQVYREQLRRALEADATQPEAVFQRAVEAAVTANHPRAQSLSAEATARMDFARSLAVYRDRFGDASDFTFVLVGNLDLARVRPLVQQYLATLPAQGREEAPADLGIRPPTGVVRRDLRAGTEPRSQVSVTFSGAFSGSAEARLQIEMMGQMLGGNLTRALREDLGGTYGVGVEPQFEWAPTPSYRLTVSFACDPDRRDALLAAMWRTIEQFRADGPSPGQVADGLLTHRRDREAWQKDNNALAVRLAQAYLRGESPAEALDDSRLDAAITVTALRDAARQVLSPERYVLVTLMPERGPR